MVAVRSCANLLYSISLGRSSVMVAIYEEYKQETNALTSSVKMSSTRSVLSSLQIDKSLPVLVTGADGYIAGVLIQHLLALGLTVHGTVQDLSKTDRFQHLLDLADKTTTGSIKLFRGELLDEGSFAEAMKGCSVVFHTASPCILSVPDPQRDLLKPAVHGTRNVLNEATKSGTVKRVVLTSSATAICNDASDTYQAPDHKLTEDIWNTGSTLEYNPYHFSKTKAELAAWELAGSQTNWTLVVMNPSMVLGPGVTYHEHSESFALMKRLGGGETASGCPNFNLGVVDVRDVAQAHIIGAFFKKAKGRYILCGTNTGFMEMANVTKTKFPDYPFPQRAIPKLIFWLLAPYAGVPRRMAWNNTDVPVNLDNTKSIQDLDIQYRPLAETMQDMFQQMVDKGVVKPKM